MPSLGQRLLIFLIIVPLALLAWRLQFLPRVRGTNGQFVIRYAVYALVLAVCLLEVAAILSTLLATH